MDFELELSKKLQGKKFVAGIDEAGRGPLAGPVAAACVILDENNIPEGINDSKKLSEKKREKLFDEILAKALCVSCVMVDEKTVDEINILQATKLAMRRAVEKMAIAPDCLLIDGNFVINVLDDETAVVGGDAKSLSIGAASIVAKVTRDRFMLEMDKRYPLYGFAKHKGYGTKAHTEAIRQFGPCEIHRKSFLTKIL